MSEMDPYQFHGFDAPRYTPTPDQLFDELLAAGRLSDPALRVLLYLIRRTFGFKKIADQVSISQIVRGIVTKDGTRLDGGAGVCKASACKATKELVAKGIICVQHNSSPARGDEATTYTLRMAGMPLAGPLPVSMPQTGGVHQIDTAVLAPPPVSMPQTGGVHQIDRGGLGPDRPRVHALNTQETDVQETDVQEDSNQRPAQKKRMPHRAGAATPTSAPVATVPPLSMRQKLPSAPVRSSQTHAAKIPEPPDSDITSEMLTEGVAHLPAPPTKRPPHRPDPEPPASAGAGPERVPAPPYSPYIAGVVQDHSTDLGDSAHWPANVTQALRLWHGSGLDEEAFVAQLHAARHLVRTYQGKQGTGTIANKMAYYFRCLADLVGVPTELGAGR